MLGLVLALCVLTNAAAANGPDAPAQLLKRADGVKMTNYAAFAAILESLEGKSAQLQSVDRDYLRYLEGWRKVYDGDYAAAVTALEKLASETGDVTLRFRARTTVINVLVLEARYEQAFSLLSGLLEQLTQISDGDAREQALVVAGQLYNEVAQYDLTLTYAQTLIDENWAGAGLCKGAGLKLPALYESGRIKTPGPEWQAGIDACTRLGLLAHAGVIRMYGIKRFIEQGRMDEALVHLKEHYEEVLGTRYPRLISAYDAMLAQVYLNKGDLARARQFASNAVEKAVKKQYTEPIVTGYRVLYEVTKQQGDFKAALAFHEEYAAADKAYLDDLSARHLAYQKVNHENIANKLQVEALNKQNHVLQLERALSAKAVETSRLYIVLLTMTIVFIALWAYRTKRSQLHFQSLSQLDGLTGICNRPHFIEQAEKALENARKTGENVCIILCDLDHFKTINDKYGHATGDFVLKRTVSACKTHLGTTDIFGRFGGEEFGVLLPSCEPEEARQRAEQLRMTIAGITAYQGTTRANVSASFGVATSSSSGYELGQLLAHADAALYEAKRTGRNRVVPHDALSHITPVTVVATTTGEFLQVASRSTG